MINVTLKKNVVVSKTKFKFEEN